jgi:hydroxyisourate hydrolase
MEGKPGSGMNIFLMKDRRTIACGITDADGRVADLLPPYRQLEAGNCTLVFQTGEYYKSKQVQTFYPVCEINFTISGDSHYHVPLLISPFGYSTYRGS